MYESLELNENNDRIKLYMRNEWKEHIEYNELYKRIARNNRNQVNERKERGDLFPPQPLLILLTLSNLPANNYTFNTE